MAAEINVCENIGCHHQEHLSLSREERLRIALTCFGSFLYLSELVRCGVFFGVFSQVQCVGVSLFQDKLTTSCDHPIQMSDNETSQSLKVDYVIFIFLNLQIFYEHVHHQSTFQTVFFVLS